MAASCVTFTAASVLGGITPALATGPTETKVACAQATLAPTNTVDCEAMVVDADPGVSPDPSGVIAFFLDAISSSTFLGQCSPVATSVFISPAGASACHSGQIVVPTGQHTVWAVYYPGSGSPYQGSVGSDDIGNPDVDNPEPSDTRVLCAPSSATQLDCFAVVADDDVDVSPDPPGTVAFFLNAISSSAFLGQCPLTDLFGSAGGVSACRATVTAPAGTNTIWAVYYPSSLYAGSVDSDQVTV
jgi:hypothetical protein